MAGDGGVELAAWAGGLVEEAAPRRRPYRSYRDTWLRIAVAVAAAPGRAAARICGESVRGEPIWRIDVAGAPIAAPLLVVAGLHAMEHAGTAVAVELIRTAAAAAARTGRPLVVVPIANPDGFLAVEASLAGGSRRLLRRNANGVDLNRNFAASWDGDYYLNRLFGSLFAPGSAPLSEPETRAIDELAAATSPHYAVSLHAFGEWIYTPYAGSRREPPDGPRMLAIARAMAARQPGRPYRVGQLGRRSRLLLARGAEIDHFYDRHGALSFLIEIGAGPRPLVPATWVNPYLWYTPPPAVLEADVRRVLPAIEYLCEV